jgi:hypothetical protein
LGFALNSNPSDLCLLVARITGVGHQYLAAFVFLAFLFIYLFIYLIVLELEHTLPLEPLPALDFVFLMKPKGLRVSKQLYS